MTEWKKPGKAADREFFKEKENEGALLGIRVRRFQEDFKNRFDEVKDTVFADVQVFDGDNAGKTYDNVEFTATALVNILKDKVTENVLGRLEKATPKGGGNKYWNLADPEDEDYELASQGSVGQSEPAKSKAPWES